MNKVKLAIACSIVLVLQSCWYHNTEDDIITEPFPVSNYSPVILKRLVFEQTTSFESPKPIVNSGKIYIKDQFLFVNEKNQGFHIFNNSNPENPINIGFLKVLGSSDIAIKGDILYVNNATDLIAIQPDFENSTFEITKRITNTFPQLFSPDGFQYYQLEADDIIVDWTLNE